MSFFSNLTLKSVVCALLIGATFMSTATAETQKNKKKLRRKSPASAMTAKSLKVEQSNKETVDMTMANGIQISLPKIEKIFDEKSLPIPSLSSLMGLEDISSETLKEKLDEQKEIGELSKKLGIDIRDSKYLALYREVADWIGTRYRRGGMSRSAVDCSGFTNLIYNQVFDKKLPRVSTEIAKTVPQTVDKEELKPGDLVFFSTLGRKYINHVGVYLGDGSFAHASIKKGVTVSTLLDGYYSKTWRKGGRVE